VLARGYGRAPGAQLNDEGAMLQRRLPWLLQQQDPDRVAAGRRLCGAGADFVVVDDGFQHRRLHRDVEIVCLDATLPFGNGQCLPAGDLREFRSGLRRADLVLLTRAAGLDQGQLRARIDRVRAIARQPELPVHACAHAPRDVVVEPAGEVLPLASLRGRRAVLLAAIARPQSFVDSARALGVDVVAVAGFRDHHRFTTAELERVRATARTNSALVLTTEKDAARLPAADFDRHVLRIDLAFLDAPPPPAEVGL
jgi:tetraacyldisaccharide 4'-kinase